MSLSSALHQAILSISKAHHFRLQESKILCASTAKMQPAAAKSQQGQRILPTVHTQVSQ